jgi:addiction module HigA family antidote
MARIAFYPGEELAGLLEALDLSAAALASQVNVPVNRITGILDGGQAVTGDMALRLAHFFGTSPELWLNLQKLYELRIAEQESGEAVSRLPRLEDFLVLVRGGAGLTSAG